MVGQAAVDFRNKIKNTRGVPKISEPKEKRAYANATVPTPIPNKETVYTYAMNPALLPLKEVENVLTSIKRKYTPEELARFLDHLALYLSEEEEYYVEIRVTEAKGKR